MGSLQLAKQKISQFANGKGEKIWQCTMALVKRNKTGQFAVLPIANCRSQLSAAGQEQMNSIH